jgi:cytochrome c peroxidase
MRNVRPSKRTSSQGALIVSLVCALALVAGMWEAPALSQPSAEPISPIRAEIPDHSPKADLGRALFSDPIMSAGGTLTCTTCHDLTTNGTINVTQPTGYNGRRPEFNVPTIFNVANNYRFGWRGTFRTLAEKNANVLLDPTIMANTWTSLVRRLKGSAYRARFRQIYGHDLAPGDVTDVLETFETTLTTPNAPFDRYLAGNATAVSSLAASGYGLFKEFGCASCHQGSNVGGNLAEPFGVFAAPRSSPDKPVIYGLQMSRPIELDGLFRVPSLRNVAVTGPYFHDGSVADLSDAIRTMARLQLGRTITDEDVRAIRAFLESLTGEYDGRQLTLQQPG